MASDETFRKLRVFVACPGDVEDEKDRLEKLIRTLQFDASNQGFILELAHRLISGRHTAVGDLADFQGASDDHT